MTLLRVQSVVLVENFGFNYDKLTFRLVKANAYMCTCKNVQYVINMIIVFCFFLFFCYEIDD